MFSDIRGEITALPARLARLTATVEPATAITSRRHRPRLVDGKVSSAEFVLIQLGNRATCAVVVVHLDERESSRLPCGAVTDNVDGGDGSSTLEQGLKIGLIRFVRQVADVKLGTHE